MTDTKTFTENIENLFGQICGEQAESWRDEDGDVHFEAFHRGVPVGAFIEPIGDRENVLVGFHIVGEGIEDMGLAAQFVNEHNHRVRVGRFTMLQRGGVVFTYQLPASALNRESFRFLLNVVAGASLVYPELAQKTGALRSADMAALEALAGEDADESQ